MKELTDNADTDKVYLGSARGLLISIPFIAISAMFEFVWLRIIGKKDEKYKNKP